MERSIGKRLRELRVAAGMTQEQLAEAAGIPKGTISPWEADKVKAFNADMLRPLAKGFGISVAELAQYLFENGEMPTIGVHRDAKDIAKPLNADPDTALFYEGWQLLTPEEKQAITNVMLRAALRRQAGDDA